MTKQYLLGMDLGTTNIKGVLLSIDGCIQNTVSEAVSYSHGQNNTVEYDTEEFFQKVAAAIKTLAEFAGDSGQIAGISMVSASGNTVLLDENNKPIRPAVNWMDRRYTDEMETVLQKPDIQKLYDTTGWPFYNSFPLAHLSWLKLNEQDNFNRAKRVCLVTDYVNYRLTDEYKTNPSTATTGYLQDQKAGVWAIDIIDKLNISEEMLPEIVKTGEKIGGISKKASHLTGLLPGTPVVAGCFDHPGAARGTGILNEGDLLLSCGTSWVGFYPVKDRNKLYSINMLIDPFMSDGCCWGGMFSLPSVGKYIDTLIKKWISQKQDRYQAFNVLAQKAETGAGGLAINPLTDLLKDFSGFDKAIIARAIMEGTARLMKEQIDFFAANGISVKRIIMAGGPTASKLWIEILCDILEYDIQVSSGNHAGAVGAAVMAGIGAGIFKDEYAAGKLWGLK